jgi:putative endonuclease
MENKYYVYILASKSRALYTGLTNNLDRRIYEHKNKIVKGFTAKYNIERLVYYEEYNDISLAIAREKEIKGWRRKKKIELIESTNPEWKNLGDEFRL